MDQGGYAMPPNYDVPQQTVVIAPRIRYGPEPMRVTCPNCRQTVESTTMLVNGIITWTAAGVLLLFCFCFSCIPFYMDSLKDVHHYCPSCNAFLGVYKKLQD